MPKMSGGSKFEIRREVQMVTALGDDFEKFEPVPAVYLVDGVEVSRGEFVRMAVAAGVSFPPGLVP